MIKSHAALPALEKSKEVVSDVTEPVEEEGKKPGLMDTTVHKAFASASVAIEEGVGILKRTVSNAMSHGKGTKEDKGEGEMKAEIFDTGDETKTEGDEGDSTKTPQSGLLGKITEAVGGAVRHNNNNELSD